MSQSKIMEVQEKLATHDSRFDAQDLTLRQMNAKIDSLDERLTPVFEWLTTSRVGASFIMKLVGFIALLGGAWLTVKGIIHGP